MMDQSYEESFDYTRHKLERAYRRSAHEKDEGKEQDAEHGLGKEVVGSPTAKRSSSLSGSDFSPSAQRRKGILKTPTVRFEEKFETEEIPYLPPPPIFPPPPPHPDGGSSHPVLYDAMQPLPPGPPMGLNLFVPGPDGTPKIDPAAEALYTKFMDELEEFVAMQGSVIKARVHVQERRTRLRLYRENVSRRDIDYMDWLRECKAKGTVFEDPKLEVLFDAAVTARDEVGPEEMDYEALEIKLGAEELALKEKYDALENRFANFFKLRPGSTTNASVPETIEFEPPSVVSDAGERPKVDQEPRQFTLFQGAFIGDQVKVGQLPLTGDATPPQHPVAGTTAPVVEEEQYLPSENLSGERFVAEPNLSMERFVSEPNSVETFWSEAAPDFESGEVRMQFSLQGLALPPINESPEHFLEDLDVDFSFEDDEVDSLLLLGTDSETHSTLSDYLTTFDSTQNRVNRWLLHKLRVSPMEVFNLRRQLLGSEDPIPDWANLALSFWETDLSDLALRRTTSPAPYPSTENLPKRHRWRKRRGPRIPPPETDSLIAFDPATQRYIQIPM